MVWRCVRPLMIVAALAVAPAAHADGDGDKPLVPRTETPAQHEAKAKPPKFLKPSQLPHKQSTPADVTTSANPAATPTQGAGVAGVVVEVPPPTHAPDTPIAIDPMFLPAMRGYWRDWTADTTPLVGVPVRTSYFTRGLYSYLTGGFHDWSGVELGARTNVADGLTFAAVFHHEYRETRGEFAMVSAAAQLPHAFELASSVGVGNGADFLPAAELELEVNRHLSCRACNLLGVGYGTSWYAYGRAQVDTSVRYRQTLPHDVGIEGRVAGILYEQDSVAVRPGYSASAMVVIGKPDHFQYEGRVTIGDSPRYAPGVMTETPLDGTLDIAVGVHQWLSPDYGHMIELDLGGQRDAYRRIGLRYTINYDPPPSGRIRVVEVPAPAPPPRDTDGDGIPDTADKCPNEPEDRDGFQDADGCPDPDNDGDGIPDRQDKCPNEPEDKDGFQDADGCPDPDNDNDGIPDAQDKCPNEPEDKDGFQDADGCPDPDNDTDGIPDAQDKCPNEPETKNGYQDEDGCPDTVPAKLKPFTGTIEGINFKVSSADLLPSSDRVLDKAVAVLDEFPELRLEIRGHTDDLPLKAGAKFSDNRALSQSRADSVMAYLVAKGVAAARLTAIGFGDTQPLVDPTTLKDNRLRAARARNRRVEFRLIESPASP